MFCSLHYSLFCSDSLYSSAHNFSDVKWRWVEGPACRYCKRFLFFRLLLDNSALEVTELASKDTSVRKKTCLFIRKSRFVYLCSSSIFAPFRFDAAPFALIHKTILVCWSRTTVKSQSRTFCDDLRNFRPAWQPLVAWTPDVVDYQRALLGCLARVPRLLWSIDWCPQSSICLWCRRLRWFLERLASNFGLLCKICLVHSHPRSVRKNNKKNTEVELRCSSGSAFLAHTHL
jgi:hypothetical protein